MWIFSNVNSKLYIVFRYARLRSYQTSWNSINSMLKQAKVENFCIWVWVRVIEYSVKYSWNANKDTLWIVLYLSKIHVLY